MIILSSLNSKKKQLVCTSLERITDIGFKIIDKLEDKIFNVDILIYRDFFERFNFCFDAIKTLLPEYHENSFSKDYTIALTLRTSLLDFLNVAYLTIHYQEYNPTIQRKRDYKSELGKILCSHLKRTFYRLNKEYLSGNFNKSNYTKTIKNLHRDYIFLFNPEESFNLENPSETLIYKQEISNKTIINKLKTHSDINIRNYGRAIGYYELYSKYEHYGILSRRFLRVDVNERFRNILESLELLIVGATAAISFFRNVIDIKNEEKEFSENSLALNGIIKIRN